MLSNPQPMAMDDDAVGSPLAFIVAGVIFLAVVGILLTVAFNAAPSLEAGNFDPGHRSEAETTFERFVRSAGTMTFTGATPPAGSGWQTASGTPGLAATGNLLDLAKLRHLQDTEANWIPSPPVHSPLTSALARDRLGLDALDLEFRVEFTAIGANCETAAFGAKLPTNTTLEPAAGTFRLAGSARPCGATTPTLVEVRLFVFR